MLRRLLGKTRKSQRNDGFSRYSGDMANSQRRPISPKGLSCSTYLSCFDRDPGRRLIQLLTLSLRGASARAKCAPVLQTLSPIPGSFQPAPATANAHNVRVTADIKLRGVNRPKLANSNVSQKTRRARNGFGVPWPSCWVSSQRVSPILAASVIA